MQAPREPRSTEPGKSGSRVDPHDKVGNPSWPADIGPDLPIRIAAAEDAGRSAMVLRDVAVMAELGAADPAALRRLTASLAVMVPPGWRDAPSPGAGGSATALTLTPGRALAAGLACVALLVALAVLSLQGADPPANGFPQMQQTAP